MLRPTINMDLSVTALADAVEDLVRETGAGPLGIVVALNISREIGEFLAEHLEASRQAGIVPPDLRLTVLKDLPIDSWMVYNHKDIWYSAGA